MPISNLWDTTPDAWYWSDVSIVIKLLSRHTRNILTRRGPFHAIPIYYAIRYSASLEIVQYLGSQMGLQQMRDWRGYKLNDMTLLHIAVIYRQPKLIPYLLYCTYGHENPEFPRNNMRNPKSYAKKLKHFKCLKLLNDPTKTIAEYKDDPTKSIDNYTFMKKIATLWDNSSAWAFTDLKHVKALYDSGIKTIRHVNLLQIESGDYICMPVLYAISWGVPADVVEWMCVCTGLEYVEDLRSPWNEYNPLHLAIFGNHSHLIPYLLSIMPGARHIKSKKDGKFGSGKGMTPIEYARRLRYSKCLSLMMKLDKKYERNKDKPKIVMINDFCDDSNWPQTTLKHCKAMLRKDPVALTRAGGSLRALPILYAIRFKARLDVVKFICMGMGIDKVKTWRGTYDWTLLHLVTFNDSIAILPYILSLNPDAINIKDDQRFKPIDIARRYNHHVCAQLLKYPDKTIENYKIMAANVELENERKKDEIKKKKEMLMMMSTKKKKLKKKKKKIKIRPLTAIGARRHRLVERKKINSNKKNGIRQQHRSTPSLPPSYGNNNPRPLTAIGLRRRRGKSTRRM